MGGRKMERFNVLLTNKRIEKKLNKAQVANKMGLTPMYYARFENGDLCPTKRNVKQFAEFLDMSEEDVLYIIESSKKSRTI